MIPVIPWYLAPIVVAMNLAIAGAVWASRRQPQWGSSP